MCKKSKASLFNCKTAEFSAPSASSASAETKPQCPSSLVESLLRQYDYLELLRDTLHTRLGCGNRRRRRWRPELRLLDRLIQGNLACLASLDIEPLAAQGNVNYAIHEPVQVLPTNDPASDGRIAMVLTSGFIRSGRLLRPMRVAILSYRPAPHPAHLQGEKP